MEYIWIDNNFIGNNHGCDIVIDKSVYLDKGICVVFLFFFIFSNNFLGMALKIYVLLQLVIYCN